MSYPVNYHTEYVEERSRLSTGFRLILTMPHLVVVYSLFVVLAVCNVAAWFAIVATGKYPEGLYNFNARVIQYLLRVRAYIALITDEYPKFGLGDQADYPVRLPIGPAKPSYSRVKAAFRMIVGLPAFFMMMAMQFAGEGAGTVAWFWILFTGKQNPKLQRIINLSMAFSGRSWCYFSLLTEDPPPFPADDETRLAITQG
jgi:hypothetical protein